MYTETEFEKLIKSVEAEFTKELAEVQKNFQVSTEVSLAKAEDGGKKPPEKKEDGKEAKPEAKEGEKPAEAKAPEGEKPAAAAPAAPAEGEMPQEAPAAAAPAAPAEGGAHDYDAEDLAHMEQMYMSMSPGELKAHHDCIAKIAKCGDMSAAAPAGPAGQTAPMAQPDVQKSELNAHPENAPRPHDNAKAMNSDKANGGIEGQAPANSPGAKDAASDANGKKGIFAKSEHDRRNGGKIDQQAPAGSPGSKSPASEDQRNLSNMEKSENAELELAKAEAAESKAKAETLQKSLDLATQILTKLVEKKSAPQGKAITSLDAITKSEGSSGEKTLTKSEIDAVLSRKAMDPKLEKSDRELINNFYLNGGSINSISHLLK
jgi:hypothetical protein